MALLWPCGCSDPNCETAKWTVLGEERIGVFAIQDISAGTELTFDYKYTWFGGARMRCACGANSCSGSFGGRSKAFQVFMVSSFIAEERGHRRSFRISPSESVDSLWRGQLTTLVAVRRVIEGHGVFHTEKLSVWRISLMSLEMPVVET